MFPLAFKKHSAHVSFAGTPLAVATLTKTIRLYYYIIVIWYVTLFSAYYYD